jgi:hypothetical protein
MLLMSTCIVRGGLVALFTLAMAVAATAQDGVFYHLVGKDFHRRNCWPQPFVCQDIPTVRAPFAMQVMNGWERQNMIGEHHFDPSNGQLTEAGKLKVQWILLDAPQQHRVLVVRRSGSPETTADRLNALREYALTISGNGSMPNIMTSGMPDEGWPAERIDRVNRKFATSLPEPKLPEPKDISSGN